MMTGISVVKRAGPEDLVSLGRIADRVFRPQVREGEGIPREFPHLFSEGNAANLFYVEEGGHPVSMVGVLKQTGIIPGAAIPMASIGSVATLPEFREKRLATQILAEVFSAMSQEDMALCLISGSRDLYQRQNALPLGQMHRIEVELRQPLPPMRHAVHMVASGDRQALAQSLVELYWRNPYRFQRTAAQMHELLDALWFKRAGFRQELFLIGPRERPEAYLVLYVSPRAVQSGVVVEWAGDRQALAGALPYIMTQMKTQHMTLYAHAADEEMRHIAQRSRWGVQMVPLQGTVRVLNATALRRALNPLAMERPELAAVWDLGPGAVLAALFGQPGMGGGALDLMLTDDLNYI